MRGTGPGEHACRLITISLHTPFADDTSGSNRAVVHEGSCRASAGQPYVRAAGLPERTAEFQAWLGQAVIEG